MLLLRALDKSDSEKVKAYRLQVKARLYRFNYVRAIPASPTLKLQRLPSTLLSHRDLPVLSS